jgi:hypothetical protein
MLRTYVRKEGCGIVRSSFIYAKKQTSRWRALLMAHDRRRRTDSGCSDKPPDQAGVSRRDVLRAGTGVAAAGAFPQGTSAQIGQTSRAADQAAPYPASRTTPHGRPYNIVLFISDEEAYHLRPAEGYSTPARAELQRRGTTFNKHYIGAAMCTPSRGVMFSGQPPQVNGV